MMNNSNTFCSKKEIILNGIKSLENLRKITESNNRLGIIIMEETFKDNLPSIKSMILKINNMIPKIKKTVMWKVPNMRSLIKFVEHEFENPATITPEKFISFLKKLFKREDFDEDIDFIEWVLNKDQRCRRAFRKI